jgi:hypothetical protein
MAHAHRNDILKKMDDANSRWDRHYKWLRRGILPEEITVRLIGVFPVWARESPSRKPHPRNQAPSPKMAFFVSRGLSTKPRFTPANAKV